MIWDCLWQHLTTLICGEKFTVDHALNFPQGGYPSIRHNELRDITADLLTEVRHSIGTEPCLQPVTDEQLMHRTANREDGARLDIIAGERPAMHFLMYGYSILLCKAIVTLL